MAVQPMARGSKPAVGKNPAALPQERQALAAAIKLVLGWDWLGDSFGAEVRRTLPALLIHLYLTASAGRPTTMREACEIMGLDITTTGPRYVRIAEEHGLLVIQSRPEDRRKRFVEATKKLTQLVDDQLNRLAARLRSADTPDSVRPAPPRTIRSPDKLPSLGRDASHLVAAFQANKAKREKVLQQLAAVVPLAAEFAGREARIASLGSAYKVGRRIGTGTEHNQRLVRELFLPASDKVKIYPGAAHRAFHTAHPDDLEVAQSIAVSCQRVLQPARIEREKGLFFTGDFSGTLILIGGTNSNALTRLVLQYEPDGEGGFAPNARAIIPVRFEEPAQVTGPHVVISGTEGHEPVWHVRDKRYGTLYAPDHDAQGRPINDFLTLTSVPNFLHAASYRAGYRILIVSGIYGAGTKAVLLLMQDERQLREIHDGVKDAVAWQALVPVPAVDPAERPRPLSIGKVMPHPLSVSRDLHARFVRE